MPSHPSRVRGLKLNVLVDVKLLIASHPFTGAWIETS